MNRLSFEAVARRLEESRTNDRASNVWISDGVDWRLAVRIFPDLDGHCVAEFTDGGKAPVYERKLKIARSPAPGVITGLQTYIDRREVPDGAVH